MTAIAKRIKTILPLVKTPDFRTCPLPPRQLDTHYGTAQHKEWRTSVRRRAGWRCEWVECGVRCSKHAPYDRMIADHIVELKDGGSPLDLSNGQCLCTQHNTLKGIRARGARMAAPTW